MDATPAAARRKKAPAEAVKKRPGGGVRGPGPGASPAAPSADPTGSGAAACCVLCACLPVAVLCVARRCCPCVPVRRACSWPVAVLCVARQCCGRWRRRPHRRLAPGGSSSFSDAEAGEFLPGGGARRRAMGREEGQPQARAHDGGTRREGRGKKEKM
ncbi:uncharacterized protein LOC120689209 [Panicum virgatum]|uniref:Uncharacterized protein n=1 Tax=Panicum virgatum TaxID=38727 RepID=A0A8T0MS25_PANVG|nr:uncharacterized protein LOC120689209 [Panicum virgatum]KAG2540281.1 hypothetical protein PVAP13_9NG539914 [Panicum virgatum]